METMVQSGQKQEHMLKDQHGKKNNQHFQHAHIVMNQYYHTEFVEIADIMMENKLLQKKNLKMHNY